MTSGDQSVTCGFRRHASACGPEVCLNYKRTDYRRDTRSAFCLKAPTKNKTSGVATTAPCSSSSDARCTAVHGLWQYCSWISSNWLS